MNEGHFEIVAILASLFTVYQRFQAVRSKRMHEENKRIFAKLEIEHEMLIEDYCERKNIDRNDLPTRHKSVIRNGD